MPARGVDHGKAELDESEVIQIYKSTLSMRKLAKRFSISHSTVFAIKQKRVWKWLTDSLDDKKEQTPKISSREMISKGNITPEGLAYLTRICVPDAKTKVNTLALSRFASYLQFLRDDIKSNRPKRVRSLLCKATLKTLKEDQKTPLTISFRVPAPYALVAYQIWEISGVDPVDIFTALIAYGLEHLAHELRQYPSFPEVPRNPEKKLSEPIPTQKQPPKEGTRAEIKPETDFF